MMLTLLVRVGARVGLYYMLLLWKLCSAIVLLWHVVPIGTAIFSCWPKTILDRVHMKAAGQASTLPEPCLSSGSKLHWNCNGRTF